MATRWIDFAELKRQVSITDVLARYGILDGLRVKKPGKLVGSCPIHGGKNGTSFNVDSDKNIFHCFSQCGGGNVLDLVMKLEDCSIREAGEKLSDWFELSFDRRGGIAKTAKRWDFDDTGLSRLAGYPLATEGGPGLSAIKGI